MRHLSVKRWSDFQHYGKRNPPWIKVHAALLSNYEFTSMPDVAKSHLILIWVLASQCNNKIPYDEPWIRARIGAQSKIQLDRFVENGWLQLNEEQDASTVLAKRSGSENQSRALSREEERREEKRRVVPEDPPAAGLPGLKLNDKSEHFVSCSELVRYVELYPAVDVVAQVRKMAGWCDSHQKQRKTRDGVHRFINSWLAGEQDGGKRKQTSQAGAGNSSVIDAITDAATK